MQWRASWKRMENEKLLRAIGLCAKAGQLVLGTPQVCEALRGKRKPYLVLEAQGNSENTAKRIADKCAYYQIEHLRLQVDGNMLSDAIGKSGRVAVVAITDENLCKLVRRALKEEHS